MRRMLLALLGCLLWSVISTGLAHAKPLKRVAVRVVDIAGGNAYLSAGTDRGLRRGTIVRFGKLERRVEQASKSFAVVPARSLRIGSRGNAQVSTVTEGTVERLPSPRPAEAFFGQWPAAVLPATQQRPEYVPLGAMRARPQVVDAALSAGGAGLIPLDGKTDAVARAEMRARMRVTPVADFPLALAADVALQDWSGRYATGVANGDARPLWRVRELALGVGHSDGYRAELGRMRYAAANLGMLDGARMETAHIGPLRLASFGGLLPDPVDGNVASGAGRFGLELNARGENTALQPELTVVMQASVFEGRIDERRLYARTQLWPGEHRVSGYAEASAFDADNPWLRREVDLTAAGADFDLRFSALHVGGRFDMRKPERSYWLERSFPATWLCASAAALDRNVACSGGDDTRYVAQAFAGYGLGALQVDLGGSWAGSSQAELGQHAMGYGTLRFIGIGDRYDLAIGGSQEGGSLLLSSSAVRADVGAGFLDERVRVSFYYRPAYRRYQASVSGLWEQGGGASLHIAPIPVLAFDLYADTRLGDVDAAMVMLNMLYRLGI